MFSVLIVFIVYGHAQVTTNTVERSSFAPSSTSNPTTAVITEPSLAEKTTKGSSIECICVPYYRCQPGALSIIRNGSIDISLDKFFSCPNYIDICCNKSQITTAIFKPTPPSFKHSRCGQGYDIEILENFNDETNFVKFPWIVAIFSEQIRNNPQKFTKFLCEGSLINTQVVVTAAHCVQLRYRHFKIRAGQWDTENAEENLYQERDVETVKIHPNFQRRNFHNDIALLFLKTPVKIAENVNVVCLPRKPAVFDDASCFATAWDRTLDIDSNILKTINVSIVPNNKCQNSLRFTRLGTNFNLHSSFFCADAKQEKSVFREIAGSPLVCSIPGEENRYQQAGIVSWSLDCGAECPGVYSNVALFRDWIDKELEFKSSNISTY